MSTLRSVLLTGAAGRIGQFMVPILAERYRLTLTDSREPAERLNAPFIAADLGDFETLKTICQGQDTIVHLGANPSTHATWEELLTPNVTGIYHIFEAARLAGCRRVVYASSINAVGKHPREQQIRTSQPVRPANLYGATKAWGEALASHYADQHNLSGICLRFGWVQPRDSPHLIENWAFIDALLTYDDCARLILASIEAPDALRFGVFHGISNNRYKRLDITDTRELLGYEPEDDGFALREEMLKASQGV